MINREEIMSIVAEKYRLIVGDSDPILSVFAISEVLYEKQNEKILAVHERESQRLLKAVQGITKEGRLDLRREFESILKAIKSENLRHEAESISISKQHLEAVERLTQAAIKAKFWASVAAIAAFTLSLGAFIKNI